MIGGAENLAAMGTGIGSLVTSGFGGLASGAGSLLQGKGFNQSASDAADTVKRMQSEGTYAPQTTAGKGIQNDLGAVGGAFDTLTKGAGDTAGWPMQLASKGATALGYPNAAATLDNVGQTTSEAVKGGLDAAMQLEGARALLPKKPVAGVTGVPKVMDGIDKIVADNSAETPAPVAPTRDALVSANKAGYFVTPKYAENSSTTLGNFASKGGSEIRMQQALSQRNAPITESLVKQELGIPDSTPLSVAAVNAVDASANNVYAAVKKTGEVHPNDAYQTAINNIGSRTAAQSHYFGSTVDPAIAALKEKYSGIGPTDAAAIVDEIKDLRDSARGNYKELSNINQARALGGAQMQAASALDELLQTHLNGTGAPVGTPGPYRGLADAFQQARTLKAKVASVRNSMNDATGEVSPASLARDFNDSGGANGPMSGNLKLIAQTQLAFPKVMQDTARLPTSEGASAVDLAMMAHGALGGRVAEMAFGAARPLGRSWVNSARGQEALVNPSASYYQQLMAAARNNPSAPFLFQTSQQADDQANQQ